MTHAIQIRQKPIRSFVCRQGRITKRQIQALQDKNPHHYLDLEQGVIQPQQLFCQTGLLVVEIGFGNGESLIAMCKQCPNDCFIGIETHLAGAGNVLYWARTYGLTNLKLYIADASDVVKECLPNNSIHRFQIYYPDPWHKKKHAKRRLIQAAFAQLLWQKTKPQGMVHIVTDHPPYAIAIRQSMCGAGFQHCSYLYRHKPLWYRTTKYEQNALIAGNPIFNQLFYKGG